MGYLDDEVFYDSHSRQSQYSFLDLEIGDDCQPQTVISRQLCSANPSRSISLYQYEDIPSYLKSNPYIRAGYRAHLSPAHCFMSLFLWNNETINIWSHLIGFMIFFVAMFVDNSVIFSTGTAHVSDSVFITLGLLCYQACMLLSAGYHMFYCHSEKACRRWLAIDLAGITLGLIGCYLPAVYLAFYCHQIWRDFYMIVVLCLSAVSVALQFHPHFLSHSWTSYRTILYTSLAAYGIIPTVHWVYLSGGFHTEVVQLFFSKVINMYILGIIALVFYLSKFPERFFRGKVDYIGSSHQWWHIIVVGAFLYWHHSGEAILDYRIAHSCS